MKGMVKLIKMKCIKTGRNFEITVSCKVTSLLEQFEDMTYILCQFTQKSVVIIVKHY